MKKVFLLLITLIFMSNEESQSQVKIPKAKKVAKKFVEHGNERIDNYYWLNQREDKEVIAYLEAENAYTDAKMKHTETLQENLFQEMKGRIKQTDMSVPYDYNGYNYYTRYEEGKEYPIYCRKKILVVLEHAEVSNKLKKEKKHHNSGSLKKSDLSKKKSISKSDDLKKNEALGEEEIMFDVNKMAEGHEFYALGGLSISNDNHMVAFFVDNVGRRKYTLKFKDLRTGKILDDQIVDASGFAWANDNKTFFYGKKDEQTLRPYQIYRQTLGDGKANLVFEEKDETFNAFVYRSKSKKYIFIGSGSTLSSEYHYLDANNPRGKFKPIQKREDKLEYSIDHYGDKFYILTNWKAKNFRLMETPVNNTEKENWQELIPNRNDVLLEGIDIFKDFLVLSERKKGLTAIRIIQWKDKSEHYLDFGESTYSAYTSTNPDFNTQVLRYSYTSMTTPNSTYDYNMKSRHKKLLKRQEIVGGYNPNDYQAERLYIKVRDGVEVPVSLVYKKGVKKDGKNPLLLYAYGSYGYSMDPYFSSVRLSLLDRGFIFAIAHIRGGEEMGRHWYEDGKMFKKKNTFYDFIDCGEYLVKEKYTNKDKLFAQGGSAGGLLMGAVMNMRPDLWKGIVAQVPFVDVVTTMLDESIPLTTGEYDEWGNPNNKDSYEYMLSYSPYDNVEAKNYPNLLVTTGLHDSQVQYWEPAKWVAKLRDLKTDDNTLLLKTDMNAGHGGKSGRFKPYQDAAFTYAFLLDLAGIEK